MMLTVTGAKEGAVSEAVSVEDLQPGDHACLTFTDPQERLDIVAAFVRDGLRAGQKVVCLTEAVSESVLLGELSDRGLPVTDTLRTGQLRVAGSAPMFLPNGTFSSARTIDTLRGELLHAGRQGYAGLRVTSDMCWALRPVNGIAELLDYEQQMSRLLAGRNATAVCQYDRQCFDTVTLAGVADTHGVMVAAQTYHDDAMLRICRQHMPPGIRVAGQIDYRSVGALKRALSESLALDTHIDVNLAELRFTDATAAGVLLHAAGSMSPEQHMTVHCPRLIFKVLTALGLPDIPRVKVVAAGNDH